MFMYRMMIAIALAASLLSGCAHDELLRLETQDYVKVADKVEASGRAFYDGMVEGDRALWAELYALDEKCTPESLRPSIFTSDTNRDGKIDDADNGFCDAELDENSKFISREIERSMFAEQYAALAFLRSFLTALANASADPELRASKEFKAAAVDLAALSKALNKKAPLTGEQVEAFGNLIDFMEELSRDHRSAKEIRQIIEDNHEDVSAAFDVLIAAMQKDKSLQGATGSLKNSLEQVHDRASAKDKIKEMRRKLIASHYARVDTEEKEIQRVDACEAIADRKIRHAQDARGEDEEKQARLEKAICPFPEAGAMLAAKQANQDFVDLALEGRMSNKQKARLMKLQRENFMRAVSIFIDLTGVF